MPLICPMCGLNNPDEREGGLCSHHAASSSYEPPWSDGNRVWCDFFHRGVAPSTPPGFMEGELGEKVLGLQSFTPFVAPDVE